MAVPYQNYLLGLYNDREDRKIQRKRVRDVCDPLDVPDSEFRRLWRINKEMAHYLISRLAPDLEPQNSSGLPAYLKVLCSVQFLANGGYQRQIGQDHTLCHSQTANSRSSVNLLSQFTGGDSGYPLEPWLITPILHAQNAGEQRFTDWHCQVRNGIERTNGYLKGSFRCLGSDRALHYAPEKASEIIYACCIVYNIMKHFRVPVEEGEIGEDLDDVEPAPMPPAGLLRQAQLRRADLILTHFNV